MPYDGTLTESLLQQQQQQQQQQVQDIRPATPFSDLSRQWMQSELTILGISTVFMISCTNGDLASLQWMGLAQPLAWQVAVSVTTAMALIVGQQWLQKSAGRNGHHVATEDMVLELFGRRGTQTSTLTTVMTSLALASSVAVSEEVMFRCYIPAALTTVWGADAMSFACLCQALLFGVSHYSIHNNNKIKKNENYLLVASKTFHGLLLGILAMTTGSLVPCIVVRLLYEWDMLASVWHTVNNQIEWMNQQGSKNHELTHDELPRECQETLIELFHAFDSEHKGCLSFNDLQRAVAFVFRDEKDHPSHEDISRLWAGRSNLQPNEFVDILLTMRRQWKNSTHSVPA